MHQKVVVSDYVGDTTIEFNGDMTVQIVQNGNIYNGKYTIDHTYGKNEAHCVWNGGDRDVFVMNDYGGMMYNQESAINKDNKAFGIYEIQGMKVSYANGEYELSIYSNNTINIDYIY